MDISDTLAPNSDQLDSIELVNAPRTFTIERVTRGNDEQPVNIHLAEFPRPWRPGKSMRRVLVACWGADASAYVGRRVRLYCDPNVRFGSETVGGTRIEALSHISKAQKVPLLVSRGKSAVFTVQPLADEPAAPDYLADAKAAQSIEEWRAVWQRAKDAGHLTDALKGKLTPLGEALKGKPQKVGHILPVNPPDDPQPEPPADDEQPDKQGAIEWPDVAQPGGDR